MTAIRRRLVYAAGPIALAAAMVIYVTSQRGPSLPDLPEYTMVRTDEKDRFELVLRPAAPPIGKVVAFAFTVTDPALEPTPLEAKVVIEPDGVVHLTGRSRALAGARDVRVVLGEPAAIGKFDDAAVRAATKRSDSRVRVLVMPIDAR